LRPLVSAGADFLAVSAAVWNADGMNEAQAVGRLHRGDQGGPRARPKVWPEPGQFAPYRPKIMGAGPWPRVSLSFSIFRETSRPARREKRDMTAKTHPHEPAPKELTPKELTWRGVALGAR
jgi:hypothetical protein